MSGAVHTGVEVYRMDSEMSRLVEQPWLQLMCCTIHVVATSDDGKKSEMEVSADLLWSKVLRVGQKNNSCIK